MDRRIAVEFSHLFRFGYSVSNPERVNSLIAKEISFLEQVAQKGTRFKGPSLEFVDRQYDVIDIRGHAMWEVVDFFRKQVQRLTLAEAKNAPLTSRFLEENDSFGDKLDDKSPRFALDIAFSREYFLRVYVGRKGDVKTDRHIYPGGYLGFYLEDLPELGDVEGMVGFLIHNHPNNDFFSLYDILSLNCSEFSGLWMTNNSGAMLMLASQEEKELLKLKVNYYLGSEWRNLSDRITRLLEIIEEHGGVLFKFFQEYYIAGAPQLNQFGYEIVMSMFNFALLQKFLVPVYVTSGDGVLRRAESLHDVIPKADMERIFPDGEPSDIGGMMRKIKALI